MVAYVKSYNLPSVEKALPCIFIVAETIEIFAIDIKPSINKNITNLFFENMFSPFFR